ncbi:hypothetical protein H0H92_009166 [Tricholoma furcatifolium]|nr:hypothetical protein H0H92_009166 [Tricholoma furcatifolium]
MFARLSAAILLVLPLLAFAGDSGSCSTGEETCCDSIQDVSASAISPLVLILIHAKNANVATLLGTILGAAAQGVTGQVGLTCTPVSALAVGGTSCSQQTVCCSDNNFNGVVALGCTPINANV